MLRNAAGASLLSVLMLALAACSSDYGKGPPVDPNLYPAKYKQQIIATLRTTLSDPTHVRNGFISEPALTVVDKNQLYTACVRYTERDFRTRQYGEPVTRIAYFYGGQLNQLVKAGDDQCANAAYRPFPEVEKLCLVEKCP